jgi:glycopeptide antibiotics resistance protein
VRSARVIGVFAFVLLLAGILYLTFRPSTNVSELSWMPERWGLWFDEHDAFRHFVGFAFLALVAFMLNFDATFNRSRSRFIRKFRSTRYKTGRLGALLVLVYLLELGQLVLPAREFDWLDVVNGWGGVLLVWGIMFAHKSRHRRQRRRRHEQRHEPINVSSVRFR